MPSFITSVTGAHPHVCGEHPCGSACPGFVLGSSPRMRGTQVPWRLVISILGLIPTYAGNTRPCSRPMPPSRAHPHVCGEHGGAITKFSRAKGSSPRMRGTLIRGLMDALKGGLIPTYAGNTSGG